MGKHDYLFLAIVLFLGGIGLASLNMGFLLSSIATFCLAAAFIFIWKKNFAFLFALLILAGSLYYQWNDFNYRGHTLIFNQKIRVEGSILNDPSRGLSSQNFYVRLNKPISGKVLVRSDLFTNFNYGDFILLESVILEPPSDSYGRYLAKEGIQGLINYPKLEILKKGQGNKIQAILFLVKNKILLSFQNLFGAKQAAFLSGINFGERGEFSQEFLEKLSLSGVRHLIALSGLHLLIITLAVTAFWDKILPKKFSFIVSFLLIFSFTAMTGFKASAVRAAFMAFLTGLANNNYRIYSPRNAIALAGAILILFNPKILLFDVGFQLSFFAIVGVIYLTPILKHVLKIKNNGFADWKKIILMSVSAQIAVAPILISSFNNFTLTSFIANIFILPIIPFLMGLGFLIGIFYYLFYPVALLMSWVAAPIMEYSFFVINLFSKTSISFNPSLNSFGLAAYYTVLLAGIIYFHKIRKNLVLENV